MKVSSTLLRLRYCKHWKSVSFLAALELSKLPAKKKLLSQLKHQQQQNAIQNQAPPPQSSISIIPINQAHSTTNSIISNNDPEPMDQDDEEINVHDDDSPLDMRITKHDSDSDSVRPSVIRRAPSFKETSNSPSRGKIKSLMITDMASFDMNFLSRSNVDMWSIHWWTLPSLTRYWLWSHYSQQAGAGADCITKATNDRRTADSHSKAAGAATSRSPPRSAAAT